MGYAIRLNGVSAPNFGLGQVTFVEDQSTAICNAFFAQLLSVTTEEKDACFELINTLVENNIYQKFSAIFPMIGASVQDKLRDLVTPSNNALYDKCVAVNITGNYSVAPDNTLKVTPTSSTAFGLYYGEFGATPFSIIGSYKTPSSPSATGLLAGTYSVDTNVNGCIKFNQVAPASAIPSLSGNTSFIDAVSFDGSVVKVYHKGTQVASVNYTATLQKYRFTRIMSYSDANYTFVGFCEQLTDEEVAIVTNAIQTFNTALNRIV